MRTPRPPSSKPHLTEADIGNLTNAMVATRAWGVPLNYHLTIWWKHSQGFSPEPRTWMRHQGKIFDAMSHWLKYNGLPVAFVWTREISISKGPHTHLFIAIPPEKREALKSFLLKSGKFECPPPGVTDEPIMIRGGWSWDNAGANTPAQQAGLLRYLCKDISPERCVGGEKIADVLGIHPQPNSSQLLGKRCGCSRSIGRKARHEAGWNEITSLAALRAALPTGKDAKRERRRMATAIRGAHHV